MNQLEILCGSIHDPIFVFNAISMKGNFFSSLILPKLEFYWKWKLRWIKERGRRRMAKKPAGLRKLICWIINLLFNVRANVSASPLLAENTICQWQANKQHRTIIYCRSLQDSISQWKFLFLLPSQAILVRFRVFCGRDAIIKIQLIFQFSILVENSFCVARMSLLCWQNVSTCCVLFPSTTILCVLFVYLRFHLINWNLIEIISLSSRDNL